MQSHKQKASVMNRGFVFELIVRIKVIIAVCDLGFFFEYLRLPDECGQRARFKQYASLEDKYYFAIF